MWSGNILAQLTFALWQRTLAESQLVQKLKSLDGKKEDIQHFVEACYSAFKIYHDDKNNCILHVVGSNKSVKDFPSWQIESSKEKQETCLYVEARMREVPFYGCLEVRELASALFKFFGRNPRPFAQDNQTSMTLHVGLVEECVSFLKSYPDMFEVRLMEDVLSSRVFLLQELVDNYLYQVVDDIKTVGPFQCPLITICLANCIHTIQTWHKDFIFSVTWPRLALCTSDVGRFIVGTSKQDILNFLSLFPDLFEITTKKLCLKRKGLKITCQSAIIRDAVTLAGTMKKSSGVSSTKFPLSAKIVSSKPSYTCSSSLGSSSGGCQVETSKSAFEGAAKSSTCSQNGSKTDTAATKPVTNSSDDKAQVSDVNAPNGGDHTARKKETKAGSNNQENPVANVTSRKEESTVPTTLKTSEALDQSIQSMSDKEVSKQVAQESKKATAESASTSAETTTVCDVEKSRNHPNSKENGSSVELATPSKQKQSASVANIDTRYRATEPSSPARGSNENARMCGTADSVGESTLKTNVSGSAESPFTGVQTTKSARSPSFPKPWQWNLPSPPLSPTSSKNAIGRVTRDLEGSEKTQENEKKTSPSSSKTLVWRGTSDVEGSEETQEKEVVGCGKTSSSSCKTSVERGAKGEDSGKNQEKEKTTSPSSSETFILRGTSEGASNGKAQEIEKTKTSVERSTSDEEGSGKKQESEKAKSGGLLACGASAKVDKHETSREKGTSKNVSSTLEDAPPKSTTPNGKIANEKQGGATKDKEMQDVGQVLQRANAETASSNATNSDVLCCSFPFPRNSPSVAELKEPNGPKGKKLARKDPEESGYSNVNAEKVAVEEIPAVHGTITLPPNIPVEQPQRNSITSISSPRTKQQLNNLSPAKSPANKHVKHNAKHHNIDSNENLNRHCIAEEKRVQNESNLFSAKEKAMASSVTCFDKSPKTSMLSSEASVEGRFTDQRRTECEQRQEAMQRVISYREHLRGAPTEDHSVEMRSPDKHYLDESDVQIHALSRHSSSQDWSSSQPRNGFSPIFEGKEETLFPMQGCAQQELPTASFTFTKEIPQSPSYNSIASSTDSVEEEARHPCDDIDRTESGACPISPLSESPKTSPKFKKSKLYRWLKLKVKHHKSSAHDGKQVSQAGSNLEAVSVSAPVATLSLLSPAQSDIPPSPANHREEKRNNTAARQIQKSFSPEQESKRLAERCSDPALVVRESYSAGNSTETKQVENALSNDALNKERNVTTSSSNRPSSSCKVKDLAPGSNIPSNTNPGLKHKTQLGNSRSDSVKTTSALPSNDASVSNPITTFAAANAAEVEKVQNECKTSVSSPNGSKKVTPSRSAKAVFSATQMSRPRRPGSPVVDSTKTSSTLPANKNSKDELTTVTYNTAQKKDSLSALQTVKKLPSTVKYKDEGAVLACQKTQVKPTNMQAAEITHDASVSVQVSQEKQVSSNNAHDSLNIQASSKSAQSAQNMQASAKGVQASQKTNIFTKTTLNDQGPETIAQNTLKTESLANNAQTTNETLLTLSSAQTTLNGQCPASVQTAKITNLPANGSQATQNSQAPTSNSQTRGLVKSTQATPKTHVPSNSAPTTTNGIQGSQKAQVTAFSVQTTENVQGPEIGARTTQNGHAPTKFPQATPDSTKRTQSTQKTQVSTNSVQTTQNTKNTPSTQKMQSPTNDARTTQKTTVTCTKVIQEMQASANNAGSTQKTKINANSALTTEIPASSSHTYQKTHENGPISQKAQVDANIAHSNQTLQACTQSTQSNYNSQVYTARATETIQAPSQSSQSHDKTRVSSSNTHTAQKIQASGSIAQGSQISKVGEKVAGESALDNAQAPENSAPKTQASVNKGLQNLQVPGAKGIEEAKEPTEGPKATQKVDVPSTGAHTMKKMEDVLKQANLNNLNSEKKPKELKKPDISSNGSLSAQKAQQTVERGEANKSLSLPSREESPIDVPKPKESTKCSQSTLKTSVGTANKVQDIEITKALANNTQATIMQTLPNSQHPAQKMNTPEKGTGISQKSHEPVKFTESKAGGSPGKLSAKVLNPVTLKSVDTNLNANATPFLPKATPTHGGELNVASLTNKDEAKNISKNGTTQAVCDNKNTKKNRMVNADVGKQVETNLQTPQINPSFTKPSASPAPASQVIPLCCLTQMIAAHGSSCSSRHDASCSSASKCGPIVGQGEGAVMDLTEGLAHAKGLSNPSQQVSKGVPFVGNGAGVAMDHTEEKMQAKGLCHYSQQVSKGIPIAGQGAGVAMDQTARIAQHTGQRKPMQQVSKGIPLVGQGAGVAMDQIEGTTQPTGHSKPRQQVNIGVPLVGQGAGVAMDRTGGTTQATGHSKLTQQVSKGVPIVGTTAPNVVKELKQSPSTSLHLTQYVSKGVPIVGQSKQTQLSISPVASVQRPVSSPCPSQDNKDSSAVAQNVTGKAVRGKAVPAEWMSSGINRVDNIGSVAQTSQSAQRAIGAMVNTDIEMKKTPSQVVGTAKRTSKGPCAAGRSKDAAGLSKTTPASSIQGSKILESQIKPKFLNGVTPSAPEALKESDLKGSKRLCFTKSGKPQYFDPKAKKVSDVIYWTSEQEEGAIMADEEERLFLGIFPPDVQEQLRMYDPKHCLAELCVDIGRQPEVRCMDAQDPTNRFLARLDVPKVKRETINQILKSECLGPVSSDNRCGIEGTLHRVSIMRNRLGDPIGLTARYGRAVFGSLDMAYDLACSGKSILLLGSPGVGKTTVLRELSRVLSDLSRKRVLIVDTSNEIAGEGDVPHMAVGSSRRMMVHPRENQPQIMIEAVQNHNPEVIIIDEIGNSQEAEAARTIGQRGVQLIATAHGEICEDLIRNKPLWPLIGGIHHVILSADEARRRRTRVKTVSERQGPAVFDVLIELQSRDYWVVYHNLQSAVDCILRRQSNNVELRKRVSYNGEKIVLVHHEVQASEL